MSSLVDMRTAIVAAVNGGLDVLKTVEPHGGRFDVEELKRHAARTPAAFVTLLGAPKISTIGGEPYADSRWAIFILAKDEPGQANRQRDALALFLAESIAKVVHGNDWGQADAQRPTGIRVDNLFTPAIDRVGFALYAVAWEQLVGLGTGVDLAALAAFRTLLTTYDLAPANDQENASDTVTLGQEAS